jgi:hypothetical protein
VTVEGRVEFADGNPASASPVPVEIGFRQLVGRNAHAMIRALEIASDGRFRLENVTPGRYRVLLTSEGSVARAGASDAWLKSAFIGGRDAAQEPVDITAPVSAPSSRWVRAGRSCR